MAIENLSAIEKSLGLEEGTLQSAIDNEESVSVEIPELEIFTKDDFNKRIENVKSEAGKAAVEIAVKKSRNDLGLDFEGKTMSNLLEAHSKKVLGEAKIEPNKKIEELTKDNELLKTNLSTIQQELQTTKDQWSQEKSSAKRDALILSSIPENTIIPKQDILSIFKSTHEVEFTEGGGHQVKKNGQVQKNSTNLDPLSVSDYMSNFSTPYLKAASGGAGAGDETGNPKKGSFEAFEKEAEDAGWSIEERNNIMSDRIKAGTLEV